MLRNPGVTGCIKWGMPCLIVNSRFWAASEGSSVRAMVLTNDELSAAIARDSCLLSSAGCLLAHDSCPLSTPQAISRDTTVADPSEKRSYHSPSLPNHDGDLRPVGGKKKSIMQPAGKQCE